MTESDYSNANGMKYFEAENSKLLYIHFKNFKENRTPVSDHAFLEKLSKTIKDNKTKYDKIQQTNKII